MNNMKKIQLGYFQPGWTGEYIKRFLVNSWHKPLVVDQFATKSVNENHHN